MCNDHTDVDKVFKIIFIFFCFLFNKYRARPYSLTPLVDIFLFALVSNVKTEKVNL